ncbi:DedA family protein [Brevibacterium album]|uniref:DedA family protein n=1 Tax=Brevibacterium album TaxID=417948 RepID=UPI00041BBC33|nr:DedA family protein [Brevibacterium album]
MDTVLSLLEAGITSPWFLLVLFLAVAVDAVVPAVPAETLLITAGTYAAAGAVELVPTILAATLGALVGDTACHHIGRGAHGTSRHLRRFRGGERAFEWVRRALLSRGGSVIITARFMPGGRTLATFASGYTQYPRRRFAVYAAIGGLLWSVCIGGIGYLGGLAFAERPLLAVAVGLTAAVLMSGVIELVRRVIAGRRAAACGQDRVRRTESHARHASDQGEQQDARHGTLSECR